MSDRAVEAVSWSTARRGALPSYILAAIVAGTTIFAFSPRPEPPFPPTQVKPDRIIANGLVRDGNRYIAVGEAGRILIADAPEGPWREAQVNRPPDHDSTLTQVTVGENGLLIAVGHDAIILRSTDHGENWQEVHFDAEGALPLLGVAGPYGGRLFAFGAFGLFLESSDGGQTWQPKTILADAEPAAPAAPAADANADPFAAFDAGADSGGGGSGERHLNGMTQAADGSLFLVGERGLMARSTDGGSTWNALPQVYDGSFFGILALKGNSLLAYGMRGNVFVSHDLGKTWKKSQMPEEPLSLFGGTVDGDGSILLTGEGSSILKSTDGGASFQVVSSGKRVRLTAVLPAGQDWLTAGEAGIALQKPDAAPAQGGAP